MNVTNITDIHNMSVQINGTNLPIIFIKIIPGRLSDPNLLAFNWTLKNYTVTELLI